MEEGAAEEGCRPLPWHLPHFMLDTAMEEYQEGNEINHWKKNKEYRVMTKILLLQVAADHYNIEPKHPFRAWFQSGKWLSEEESYILSCQLEPRT
ncbi:Ral guanine nucleotide dissociation stimulator [Vulpes lagopus]